MMSLWAGLALLVSGLGIVPLVLSASQAARWERDSLAHGQAALLAQDLAHRLHLNISAAAQYQLSWGPPPAALTCRGTPCSRTSWAQADLAEWRTQVAQLLPEGDAWLQASGVTESTRWLVLAWSSDGGGDVPASSRLPVSCPERKRCAAWVLSP